MDVNTKISFLFNLHNTECWCNFMIVLIIEAKYLTQRQNLYCYKRSTNYAFNDSNILLWSLSDKLIHFGFGHAFWWLSIFQVENNFTLTKEAFLDFQMFFLYRLFILILHQPSCLLFETQSLLESVFHGVIKNDVRKRDESYNFKSRWVAWHVTLPSVTGLHYNIGQPV